MKLGYALVDAITFTLTNNGGFMKKSTKLYHWLFTEDERAPMGFIPTFFMTILISAAICWFMTGIMGLHP